MQTVRWIAFCVSEPRHTESASVAGRGGGTSLWRSSQKTNAMHVAQADIDETSTLRSTKGSDNGYPHLRSGNGKERLFPPDTCLGQSHGCLNQYSEIFWQREWQ